MSDGTAQSFGRVDADGTVYVRLPDGGEQAVGQWAASGDPAEGLAFFARKYADLLVEVELAERRLREGKANPDRAMAVAAKVREHLAHPSCVGDLAALAARADGLAEQAGAARAAAAQARVQAQADALAARERIAAEAESLAESTAWKATGDRFRAMLDEWKAAPRAERAREQELWRRFSAARSVFDKRRRQHFAQLDAERREAVAAKEGLVAEAEALSASHEWGPTAAAYRDLMTRWKAAPRGARTDEDRLWQRFRAAQDAFFAARSSSFDERDAGLRDNLVAKEALLAEAEALLPVRDPRGARAALRGLLDRWDRAGNVPRADRDRVESRLHRVEEAVRRSEADEWRRTDPAARARAEDTVGKFRVSVDKLHAQRARAADAGDDRRVAEVDKALATTQMLLEAAERALAEFSA